MVKRENRVVVAAFSISYITFTRGWSGCVCDEERKGGDAAAVPISPLSFIDGLDGCPGEERKWSGCGPSHINRLSGICQI